MHPILTRFQTKKEARDEELRILRLSPDFEWFEMEKDINEIDKQNKRKEQRTIYNSNDKILA